MKAFIFVFDNSITQRQTVLDFLDTRLEVLNWYALFPNMIIIISETDASTLQALIRGVFPTIFFVVSQIIPGLNDGWLPKAAWDFINNPKSSGRWI